MNLTLLANLNKDCDLQENWLTFKNDLTLKYTYYYEMTKEECIGAFKLVQEFFSREMVNKANNEDTLKMIRWIKKDLKEHLEYLQNLNK